MSQRTVAVQRELCVSAGRTEPADRLGEEEAEIM